MKHTIIYALLTMFLAGCGYTTGSVLPAHIRTIYVKPFSNEIDITKEVTDIDRYKIYRPTLEIDITKAVVNRFLYDGTLRVVEEKDADVVLSGAIISFKREPLRYTEDDEIEEYRLRIAAKVVFEDRRKEKILWEETVSNRKTNTYFTQGSEAKSEIEALDETIEDVAKRIVNRTVEAW